MVNVGFSIWFGDPQEPFFYRLDWVANMWAISLRHYKEDKSPGDLKRMERIAEFLSKRFAEKRITTAEYRSRRGAAESTCILVDPGRSPGLCHLAKIHRALIDALF